MYVFPDQFDKNEITVIIFGCVFLLLFIILPKRFPTSITITILIFGSFSARLGDIMFYPFDLYDVMDEPKHNIFDLFLYTFIYSLIVYMYCYFYDKIKLKNGFQVIHIYVWLLISVLFEWSGHELGVYTYKGWKIYYSPIVYLFVLSLYTFMLNTVTSYHSKKLTLK